MRRNYSNYKSFSVRRKEKRSRNNLIFTLIAILFLLYAFLAWILPAVIGGASLLNKFKSQPKPSPILNESDTLAPPVLNIPYEATNTATIKISGYASANTKVEIYVDDTLASTADVESDGSFVANDISLNLGTNNIYGKTITDSSKSLPSKTIKIAFNNQKPKLSVSSPQDNQVIKGGDKKVTVSGSTDPGDTVTANGQQIIVNSDGNFSQSFSINDGDNNIVVVAQDSAGNQTQATFKVTYQSS